MDNVKSWAEQVKEEEEMAMVEEGLQIHHGIFFSII